ncbi:MAG: DUF6456 domain-containing protein [Hyphomicrobiaceae bacterium]|nr:DUF6456 domain-containing protein [Hyphomicrobiaceae bacterium]
MTEQAGTRGSAGASDILRALRLLVRTGAVGRLGTAGAADVRTPSAGQSWDAASAIGTISRDVWDDLFTSGAIVEASDPNCWRISEAGRLRLKRLLSQAGGETTGSSPTCAARPARLAMPVQGLGREVSESPLSWLRNRSDRAGTPYLSDDQFAAGERLRADFTRGQMMPRVTSNWSPIGAGNSASHGPDRELLMQDATLAARERVRRALAAVGPELAGVLLDVCCYLKGLEDVEREARWPARSGKLMLKTGLAALARHYGIGPRTAAVVQRGDVADGPGARPSRQRHG